MAIGDLTSKVIVEYRADTDDLKRGIRDLQGEEKKLAQAQLDAANARNKQLDQWVAGIGKATLALGAAATAGAALWAGIEHSARKAQLQQNVLASDLERLRKGFGGLRSEMQALEAANTLAQTKFKLTGNQMEMVGQAMRQMVREGHDWDEVTKKVTESLVKLSGKGLDDFGIHVRDAKTDAEKFAAMLDALGEKSGRMTSNTKTSAEELAGLKTRFVDVMDSVKDALGEIGKAFIPIVESLAEIARLIGPVVGALGKAREVFSYVNPIGLGGRALRFIGGKISDFGSYTPPPPGTPSGPMSLAGAPEDPFAFAGFNQSTLGSGNPFIREGLTLGSLAGSANDALREANMAAYLLSGRGGDALAEIAELAQKNQAAAKLARETYDRAWNRVISDMLETGKIYEESAGHELSIWAFSDSPATFGSISAQPGITDEMLQRYAPGGLHDELAYNRFQQSRLEGIFGPLSDFDAYKTAFETLNGAIGTAFGAWIDGSKSASEAFKGFIADALKGLAVQMAMEAVKHGAYAIGNLAFGNFAGAAAHGKAAAAFAAGAVAVGAAAKGLHGGGSPGASAPGGGVSAIAGGSAGAQQGGERVTVIAYGQDFTDDSARQRQLRAARVLEDARQAETGSGVTYA